MKPRTIDGQAPRKKKAKQNRTPRTGMIIYFGAWLQINVPNFDFDFGKLFLLETFFPAIRLPLISLFNESYFSLL